MLAVALCLVAGLFAWQDADPLDRLRAGDLAGALAAADARLAVNPDDALALAVRGRVRLDLPDGGDPGGAAARALDDLERAVAAGVADAATLLALSRAHATLRDLVHDPTVRRVHDLGARENGSRARATAEAAVAAAPGDRFAQKALADVLLAQGEPEAALALFEEVLAAPPAGVPAAFLQDARRAAENARAEIASRALAAATQARDFPAALRHGLALMALAPDDPQPCVAVGWARLQLAAGGLASEPAFDLRTQAADAYAEAVARDVRRRAAADAPVDEACAGLQDAYQLALAFIGRGRGDAGRALLRRLHGLLPAGRMRARVGISIATEEKEAGALPEAIASYGAAIDDYLREPLGNRWDGVFLGKAWGDLALVYRGRMFLVRIPAWHAAQKDAHAAFGQSIALAPAGDPYAVYARANLARLLAEQGESRSARALLREALDQAALRAAPDGTPDEAARVHDTLLMREFLRRVR